MTEQTKQTNNVEKQQGLFVEALYLGYDEIKSIDDKSGELTKLSFKVMFLLPTKVNRDGTFANAQIVEAWFTLKRIDLNTLYRFIESIKKLKFSENWLIKVMDVGFGDNQKKSLLAIATKEQYEAFKSFNF